MSLYLYQTYVVQADMIRNVFAHILSDASACRAYGVDFLVASDDMFLDLMHVQRLFLQQ